MAIILFCSFVYAGNVYGNCAADKSKATAQGNKAVPTAAEGKAVEDAAAANAASQASQSINPNANLSSNAGAQCAQGYKNTLDKLTSMKKGCDVPCSCTPSPDPDQQQQGPCNQAKSECNKKYDEQIAQSSGGQAGCQQAKDGADKTKDESKGGQPPQMPQMPKGDDATPEPVAATPASTTDCGKVDSYNNPDCNEKMLKDCAGSSTAKCESFGFRYCTPGASGGTGEGVGTEHCKKRVAENFCKDEGKNICPTCKQMQMQNSDVCKDRSSPCVAQSTAQQLEEAKKSCPTDPIFTDPKLAASGSSGGLGSSGATGGGAVGSGLTPAVPEEKKNSAKESPYKKLDTSAEGGGGFSGYGSGASHSSSSSEDPYSSFNFKGLTGGGKKPASVGTPIAGEGGMLTTEVHNRTSKSLFTMSSEAYQDRCARGLINHCGPD
jgi:hypothetical protein